MDARKLDENAIPIIYSVKATSDFNHKIATKLRSAFEKGKIQLLQTEIEAKDDMIETQNYMKLDSETQTLMLRPYYQATALTNELVNLVYRVQGGLIKIEEVGNTTKDRYSSIAYCNYYASVLEEENLSNNSNRGILDYFLF